MKRFRTLLPLLAAGLLLFVAASGCDSSGEDDDEAPAPQTVALSFDDEQTFVPSDTVEAEAQVSNSSGQPVSGVRIDWTVATGGGNVTPATSITNAEGVATTSWQLGTEAVGTDAQALRAAVESDEDVDAQQAVAVMLDGTYEATTFTVTQLGTEVDVLETLDGSFTLDFDEDGTVEADLGLTVPGEEPTSESAEGTYTIDSNGGLTFDFGEEGQALREQLPEDLDFTYDDGEIRTEGSTEQGDYEVVLERQ